MYVIPNRISFTGLGTDSIEYAWMVWDDGARRSGSIRVLPSTNPAIRKREKAEAKARTLASASELASTGS